MRASADSHASSALRALDRIRSFTAPAHHLAIARREDRVDSAQARCFRVQLCERARGASAVANAMNRAARSDCAHQTRAALRFLRIRRNCVAL